ncbi:MAG: putative ATPase/DNA-binding SARP family transcriptional activator [Verrucomicrobiales bacterium]|jgi:predicted ATPase/DNA-binding SARP family transcriptional activator
MEFHVLGALEVIGPEGDLIIVSSQKQRALLLYLLVNRGRVCSADRILHAVWEENTPKIKNVQFQLSKLRDVLEPRRARGSDGTVIATAPAGYVIDPASIKLDADQFERYVADALRIAQDNPLRASTELAAALDMWNGPALSDVSYLTFAQLESQRLEELKLECLEQRIALDIELGSAHALTGELEVLVREHPFREPFWGQLMLCLYRSGRQAEALRVYQEAHRTLGEELGLEPSAALRSLESQMLRQDPELTPIVAAAETALGNIDHRTSVFVGRSEEIGQIDGLLGHSRLVTLAGVGGVGKTSLALRAARQAAGSWPDGVWLVEFGPVSGPQSVPDVLAAALRFTPKFGEDMLEGVVNHLQRSSRLIILDNCEHVVDAAASLVDVLLSRCPDVHLLVTSREPLRLPDETVMTINPMDTPPSEMVDLDAPPDVIELFVQKAKLADPTFELTNETVGLITKICKRLDGLPLAVELAAAPLRALMLTDIAEGLNDRFSVLVSGSRSALAHQRTLEATVDWSFDLLQPDEKSLFVALGIFAGAFDRFGAEKIAVATGIEACDVLPLLVGLVDKSLLEVTRHSGGISYRMLTTIQHYARLKQAGQSNARSIAAEHSNWAISLAEAANAALYDGGSREWLHRIERARDDIEVVLERSREQGSPETGMRLLAALQAFLVESGDHGGFLSAGVLRKESSWADRLVGAGEVPDDVLASVLSAQGLLLILQNNLTEAIPILERCLELCASAADDEGSARAKLFLAIAIWSDDDN